ncbi:MAG TPA: DinB family protein [Thermoanaerobaculia bacterium]|nr:DinB family protein [Thermoanaerobaculia bacterium]
MKKTVLALLLCAAVSPLLAQETKPATAPAVPPSDPAMTGLKVAWNRVKDITVRAAKKMPEESYGFQATPEVKTFGQFVGHLADSTYMMAGPVLGEAPPAPEAEKTKKSKAELVAALEDSFAYMDRAFALGDAAVAAPVKLFGMDTNKFAVVGLAIGHTWEHYGNMVTYMRMKGIVPPSSEPRPAPPAPEKK